MAKKITSFARTVSKNASPVFKKEKKAAPPVIFLNGNLASSLTKFNTKKLEIKNAEIAMREAEVALIEHTMTIADKNAFDGKFSSSYILMAGKDRVTFSTVDKFNVPQDEANISALRGILESDFNKVLKKKVSITVKDSVFEDDKLQKELMALIGEEKFAKFFDVEKKWIPVEGLNEKIYAISADSGKLSRVRSIVKQSKPTIK